MNWQCFCVHIAQHPILQRKLHPCHCYSRVVLLLVVCPSFSVNSSRLQLILILIWSESNGDASCAHALPSIVQVDNSLLNFGVNNGIFHPSAKPQPSPLTPDKHVDGTLPAPSSSGSLLLAEGEGSGLSENDVPAGTHSTPTFTRRSHRTTTTPASYRDARPYTVTSASKKKKDKKEREKA